MLLIFLIIAICIVLGLLWYTIQLIKKFLFLSENLEEFFIKLEEYSSHVDIIYNLESFYGDQTLLDLLNHSKAIVEEVKIFREIYDTDYTPEEEDEELDDDTEV